MHRSVGRSVSRLAGLLVNSSVTQCANTQRGNLIFVTALALLYATDAVVYTALLVYLFIHSFIHSCVYSLISAFIHSFIYTFIHSFMLLFILMHCLPEHATLKSLLVRQSVSLLALRSRSAKSRKIVILLATILILIVCSQQL